MKLLIYIGICIFIILMSFINTFLGALDYHLFYILPIGSIACGMVLYSIICWVYTAKRKDGKWISDHPWFIAGPELECDRPFSYFLKIYLVFMPFALFTMFSTYYVLYLTTYIDNVHISNFISTDTKQAITFFEFLKYEFRESISYVYGLQGNIPVFYGSYSVSEIGMLKYVAEFIGILLGGSIGFSKYIMRFISSIVDLYFFLEAKIGRIKSNI